MAEFEGTVQLTGLITPVRQEDTYAVIDPLYGVDGLRSVRTINERDAISLTRRRLGMLVYVLETDLYYKLVDTPEHWVEFTSNADTIVKSVDRAITSYFDVEEDKGVFRDKRYLVLESTNIADWLTPPTPAVNNIIEYVNNEGFIEAGFQDGTIVVEKESLVIWAFINGAWTKLTASVQIENISDGTAQPVYVGEVGEVQQFVGIKAVLGEGVTVEYDTSADAIAIGLNPSIIDHDSLLNYEADQHVPHSSINIVAGEGLAGGGSIDNDVTISLAPINPETTAPAIEDTLYKFGQLTVGADGRVKSIIEDLQESADLLAPLISLEDLANTDIITPNNFDIIRYDTAQSEWSTWPMPPKISTSNVSLNEVAASGLDKENDLHINQTNGELSKVLGGVWKIVGSLQGPAGGGIAGRGIQSITLLNDDLLISYTDSTNAIVGPVIGADGAPGPQGIQGPVGAVGPAGLGYTNATISPSGNLTLTSTTGQQLIVGNVIGPTGPTGAQGLQGTSGIRGSRWTTGPAGGAAPNSPNPLNNDLYLDTDGNIQQFLNNSFENTYINIRGPQGPAGQSVTVFTSANQPTNPSPGDVWIL